MKKIKLFNRNKKEIDMETKEEMMAMDVNTLVKPKRNIKKMALEGVLGGACAIAGVVIGCAIWGAINGASKESGSDDKEDEIEVIDTEVTETPVCEEADFTEVE